MLEVIAASGRPVGLKPAGGISTADAAGEYIALAERIMGHGWVRPSTFRFGASGLLNALLVVAGEPTPAGAQPGSY
jgi:deoxyribose-phosphate aldolase